MRWLSILVAMTVPAAGQVSFERAEGRVDVSVDGKPFTSIHHGARWDKPFLHPVRSASGEVVTRGWPVDPAPGESNDHVWHRGLFWGHGDVNGADFWREIPERKTSRIVARGDPRIRGAAAEFACDLVAHGGVKEASLVQRFAFGGAGGARWIDATFTVRADQGKAVKLGDTEEGALGFRYSDDFREDRGARLANSDGLTGTKQIWGKRARWTDYSVTRNGKPLGVTIMDHPSNPRHPTYWHARGYGLNAANAFGVRDFTKDKSRDGSFAIAEGESATWRFRVVVREGGDPEGLYAEFAK